MSVNKLVHVMVGVIWGQDRQIFIAKRADDAHQGGLWEFPGGKLELGESPLTGLSRELEEELGIVVVSAEPMMQQRHDYPDKSVLLDVWQVTAFTGKAHGREGQETQWVNANELNNYDFPKANRVIIERLLDVKL